MSLKLYKILFLILVSFLIFSCKSDLSNIIKIQENYDKYEDEFINFEYRNKNLGIKIIFDKDWVIATQYKDFSDNQKKFAKYFSTSDSEVLFIGFNESKKIGIKFTKESLGLTNMEYLTKIKATNNLDIANYNIFFQKEEQVVLKNLQTTNLIFDTKINANNIFTFDIFLFKNLKDNFRLDFWTEKSNFDTVKEYLKDICQTIDFPEGEKIKEIDRTSDITIKIDQTGDTKK